MLRASSSVFSFFVGLVDDIDTIIVISYASLSLSLSLSLCCSCIFSCLTSPVTAIAVNESLRAADMAGEKNVATKKKREKVFCVKRAFFDFLLSSTSSLSLFSLLSLFKNRGSWCITLLSLSLSTGALLRRRRNEKALFFLF